MSCCDLQPFGNLQTGRRQGLHQGDRDLRGQPNGGLGQWTAADYDTLGPPASASKQAAIKALSNAF